MEYFYEFQNWLNGTRLYQEVLKELPVPLNNIYFDSIFLLCVAVYLLYRFLEAIYLALYRRRMRKRWEKERKRELARELKREREMVYREMKVRQKEEKVNRFMDYIELLFVHRSRRKADCESYTDYSEYAEKTAYRGQDEASQKEYPYHTWSAQTMIEGKNLLLGMNDLPLDNSDFERKLGPGYKEIMDSHDFDVEAEEKLSIQTKQKQQKQNSRLQELDELLQMNSAVIQEAPISDTNSDSAMEKRKKRARKAAEKERRKAERIMQRNAKQAEHGKDKQLNRQGRKGAGHGRLGKNEK